MGQKDNRMHFVIRRIDQRLFVVLFLIFIPACGGSQASRLSQANGPDQSLQLTDGQLPSTQRGKPAYGQSDAWNASFNALANALASNCKVQKPTSLKVAVLDFLTPSGAKCSLSAPVAEVLSNSLFYSNFKIVERRMLEQIIKELKFVQEDVFDPQKVALLGKQVGADALVIGTIEASYTDYAIRARMIESESGLWISAANINLEREVAEQRGRCRAIGLPIKSSAVMNNGEKATERSQVRRAGKGFLFEDFQNVATGEVPEGWVASDRLMVQGNDRDRGLYITSRKGKASAVIGGVKFPADFRLEFILAIAPGYLSFNSGDLNFNVSGDFYGSVSLCGERRGFGHRNTFVDRQRHALVLEKKRHVVRLMIDGNELIVLRKSEFSTGDVIQLGMSEQMVVYRISGEAL